jgi:hypothetical protein
VVLVNDLSQAYAAPPLPALFSITSWSVIALFSPLGLYLTFFSDAQTQEDRLLQPALHPLRPPSKEIVLIAIAIT